MSRNRSETIGQLGRSPARSGRVPVATPPPKEPEPDDKPKRGAVGNFLHDALFENTGLKFLSMVLAVTVFLLVNADKDREITTRVGVRYTYPPDKVLVSEQLEEVKVTLKGPMRRLRQTSELSLMEVDLDLHNQNQTSDVVITNDMIRNVPPGLDILSISPRSVRVVFDKRVEKLVEVSPSVTGRPQHGYVVAEIKAQPPTIKVRGGERLLAALTSIKTADVSLEGRTEPFEQLAEIAVPDGVSVDPTQRIGVQVRISEELVTKKVPALVVTIASAKGEGVDATKWQISPAQVEVTLTGTLLAVEKAKDSMTPIVKLTKDDGKARDVDVVLDGLPPGVGVRISPERVRVTPIKPTP